MMTDHDPNDYREKDTTSASLVGQPSSGQAGRRAYTCADRRHEMMLIGLRMRLENADLDETERHLIMKDIRRLEAQMCLD